MLHNRKMDSNDLIDDGQTNLLGCTAAAHVAVAAAAALHRAATISTTQPGPAVGTAAPGVT